MKTLTNKTAVIAAGVMDDTGTPRTDGAEYYGCGRSALPRSVLVSLAVIAFMLAIAGSATPVASSECPTGLATDHANAGVAIHPAG